MDWDFWNKWAHPEQYTALGHQRADHEDCECAEELDHALHDCPCPGYEMVRAMNKQ